MENSKNVTVLFPIELGDFWREMRRVVIEELDARYGSPKSLISTDNGTWSPRLLKAKEVCELFQISKPTIYEWMRKGQLQSVKIEGRRFFLETDLEDLIKRGRGGNARPSEI